MPYKDIKLTLPNGEKILINPSTIMGMLGLSECTMLSLVRQEIAVMEKIDKIKNLIEVVGEEEYWKMKMKNNGINMDKIAYDHGEFMTIEEHEAYHKKQIEKKERR
jgi:hypothetical protein